MNHYEELGIPQSATAEQLREAHRAIARLLHPDQQQDEALRRMGEIQMKRLNAIYAVLTDPERRRRYDAELARAAHWPSPVVIAQPLPVQPAAGVTRGFLGGLAWLAAAVLGIAGLGIYLAPQRGDPFPAIEAAPVPPLISTLPGAEDPAARYAAVRGRPAVTPLPEPAPASQDPEAAVAKRSTPARIAAPAARAQEPLSSALDRETAPGEEARAAPQPIPVKSAPAPAPSPPEFRPAGESGKAAQSRYAGTWVFTPAKSSDSPGLYPPEFIETTIAEQDGAIRGRYRARYRVADKPISPDVVFYFEGAARDKNASLRWSAGNGSRGDLRLKLLSENSMEVSWNASELGRTQGLASGTAVLVRRREQ